MSFLNTNTGSVTSYGFGDWGNRFPGDTNTGTENPKTNPERTQRIQYLENKVYQLKDIVRSADAQLNAAENKVNELSNQLSSAKERAYSSRQKHLELGNKKAGLEGQIAGNKQKIRDLEERLRDTTDTWTANDLRSQLEQRQNNRWALADQLSSTTNAYYSATESMHAADNEVSQLSNSLSSAKDNIWTVKENARARQEQLTAHVNELNNLKNS